VAAQWFGTRETNHTGEISMAYVVTQPCFGCKYTDCVVVCPCESFREGEQMLFIDPESCVDCDACVPECPVEAIFYEEDVPPQWRDFIQLNAEMSRVTPSITQKKTPLIQPG
jgi:ferredoxin